jgi:hypothetical protein
VAAVGLVHFVPSGRLVEVCGTEVRTFYERPYPLKQSGWKQDGTVAFFDLAVFDDTLCAVGVDGIHRIKSDGSSTVDPLPKFRSVGGIWLNDERPDRPLILSTAWLAVSGGVPKFAHR